MAAGPSIPVPPPVPQAPHTPPHNQPMAGAPMVPLQQHHGAPHGGQHQAPHGNIIHQPGFQGQHAQGGGHGGQGHGGQGQFGQGQLGQGQLGQGQLGQGQLGQGQGNAKLGGQNQQSQKTSFKYFQLRKPNSRDVEIGVRPSWSMSKPTEVYITSAEIEEKVRQLRLRSKMSVSDEYDALPSSVKGKVDQLLHQQRAMDIKDLSMLWNLAAIGAERRRIGFAASELVHVRVYIKKTPRTDMAGNKDKALGAGQQGMGGMNQGGAQKQGQMPMMQNMPMQNAHMGNQHGGGFHGMPNGAHNVMPNMGQHMQHPNAGGHMQHPNMGGQMQHPHMMAHGQHPNAQGHFAGGPVPANINVLEPSFGRHFQRHDNHGGGGRKRHGKSKRGRKNRRNRESDYDDFDDSDGSSRSSRSADHSDEIDDLRDELKELKFDLKKKERREARPFNRRRWSASASYLPRVPIGEHHREPAHHDAQKVHVSRHERKIHYTSPDDSDGVVTERSGRSIESWVAGSSAFSRPASDPAYTPPHSPGPRHSRDSYFREHTKPRVAYPHTPPRSPHDRGLAYSLEPDRRGSRIYLDSDRRGSRLYLEPERRSSRVYLPDLVEKRSSKVYLPFSDRRGSKVYLSDLSEKRSSKTYLPVLERRHTYDGGDMGRKMSDAEFYIMSKERRPGRRDSWRRDEEDRYRGDDRYYSRSYHR